MLKKMLLLFAAVCGAVLGAAEVKLNDGWVAKYSGNFEIKAVDGGFEVKALKGGKILEIRKDISCPVNSRLVFSADIKSTHPDMAQLMITQFDGTAKNDKNKSRTYNSRCNFAPFDRLIAESDIRNDRPVTVWFKISAPARNAKVFISNISIGEPTGNGKAVLEVAPSYVSAGYEVSNLASAEADDFKAQAFYREKGKEFRKAYTPDFPPKEHKARGVLVNLKEDTEYELKLEISDKGRKSVLTSSFRTLGKKLPVEKTVYITPEMAKKGIVISKSGSENGYIRYTSKPGVVLTSSATDAIKVNADHIIIEGLTLRGGNENGIKLTNCRNIVIRNCDIAKFGRVGVQKTHRGGEYYTAKNRILNTDSGIWMRNVKNILIENNFIHDPNGYTNPWFYSHPTGPKAIFAGMVENATLRFNDFIGGDIHRWNDAVECIGNSDPVGGFFRNAEIYGNLFANSNDDGIELEGGEINTRFFSNRIETTLCGVSSGCCVRGPSYIFNNLFWRGRDVFGLNFYAFKNGHSNWGSGKVHLFNNTATGYRGGTNSISMDTYRTRLDKMVNYNNIFALNNEFGSPQGLFKVANCPSDYNLHFNPEGADLAELRKNFDREANGVAGDPCFADAAKGDFKLKAGSPAIGKGRVIDNFTAERNVDIGAFQGDDARALPLRNLAFVTDTALVDFKSDFSQAKKVILTTKCPKAKIPFVIAKTYEAEWLTVTPAKGIITKDKPVTLTVKIDPGKFKFARLNGTVFLVRTASGMSRPVSVEADTRKDEALLKANRKGVLYADVKNSKRTSQFSFNVPAAGYYFVMLYGKKTPGKSCSVTVICDGKKLYKTRLFHSYQMTLTSLDKESSYFNLADWKRKNAPIKLSKGKHTFKIVYEKDYAPEGAALIANADQLMQSACVR